MRPLLLVLFALAAGLTLSGIAANLYRILAHKPHNRGEKALYYAVMTLAGPSVLFNNATRSFRRQDCSAGAYFFAVLIAAYWCFALGLTILAFSVDLKPLYAGSL